MQKLAMALCVVALFGLPMKAEAFSLKTTEAGVPVRWEKSRVALRIDPALEAAFGKDAVRRAAVVATEAWRGLANAPDVVVEDGAAEAYDAASRHNGIYLLNEWPYAADQVAMTITTYTPGGEIVGVDILINGERSFEMLPEPSTGAAQHDLAAVLTHEVGHVLGLAHSDDDPEATMYSTISAGETKQRTLESDDEAAIMEVYAKPMRVPAQVKAAACSVTEGRSGNGWLGGVLGMLGVVTVLRRRRAH